MFFSFLEVERLERIYHFGSDNFEIVVSLRFADFFEVFIKAEIRIISKLEILKFLLIIALDFKKADNLLDPLGAA